MPSRPRTGLLLALLIATGCTRVEAPSAPGGRHPWTRPGELRIATSVTPNTLNPLLSTEAFEAFAEGFVFDPLVATRADGSDVPVLASVVPTLANGGIARDGVTITYHLRHGVRWQDGAPFTSRDVAFTVAAIMNPKTAVATRHGYDLIDRVTTPDPYTAVFHLRRPFAPAVHTFFAHSDVPYFVLPEHLLSRYPSLDRLPYNAAPVGTGPFRVVRWTRGDAIELVSNERYFRGAPKLHRITLRTVPDENTIVNQLRAHEIDDVFEPTAQTYPQLRTIPGLDVRLVPTNTYDAIQINVAKPPFDDPRVRAALARSIDKARLTHDLSFDTAIPATEDLPRSLWAFDPHAGSTARDLAAAGALLDAAGWTRSGATGIRTKNGRPLEAVLAYPADSVTDRGLSVLIAADAADAGFRLTPKAYTGALLFATLAAGGLIASGRYDLRLQTWIAGTDPDNSSQLLCSEFPPAGFNRSRYCNPQMDQAQQIALGTYDRARRRAAYGRIESLLARDNPYVYLWWQRRIAAVNSDLRHFAPNGIVDSWNAWEWSI